MPLPEDKNNQDVHGAAVSTQLFQTQILIQTLLSELRENSNSQAAVQSELKQLRMNVATLSNIIRGDDGNTKSMLFEIERLKLVDGQLEKRLDDCVEDVQKKIADSQEITRNAVGMVQELLQDQRRELEEKIDINDQHRIRYDTAKLAALQADRADIRSDARTHYQARIGIVLAIISLIATIVTVAVAAAK